MKININEINFMKKKLKTKVSDIKLMQICYYLSHA